MTDASTRACTAFRGFSLLASGTLVEVALTVKAAEGGGTKDTILVFDDLTGRVVDLDLRGSNADVVARLADPVPSRAGKYRPPADDEGHGGEAKARGRPKLGVISREVTLLPRHWEWLAAQPGGASAVLRRLVEDARHSTQQQRRAAQDAAYHFMQAMAGDLPGFEEATRALFANNQSKLEECSGDWPPDIRAHALRLASGVLLSPTTK